MSKVANLYLKLTSSPEVTGEKRFLGEATDSWYKDQIEIDSWSWDLSRSTESSASARVGLKAPPPNAVVPSAMKVTKAMCRATSGMLAAMKDGGLLKAVFSLEEFTDVFYCIEVTLDRARIIEYELGIDGPEMSETWKFNYESIRIEYFNEYSDRNARGGSVTTTLTRHPGASNKDPAGSNAAKIIAIAETMQPKELAPLSKTLDTMSKRTAVPAKAVTVTKKGPG